MSLPKLPFTLTPEEQALALQVRALHPKYTNCIFFAFVAQATPDDGYQAFLTMQTLFGMTAAEVLADNATRDLLDVEPLLSILFMNDAAYQSHILSTLGQNEFDFRSDLRNKLF